MHRNVWLGDLRRELESYRLPVGYVREYLAELEDHLDDLTFKEHEMSTVSSEGVFDRLGQPRELAQEAAQQFDYPTWLGRHPWLSFVVAPVPLLLSVMLVYLSALVLIGEYALDSVNVPTVMKQLFGFAWQASVLLVPAFLGLVGYSWLRSSRSWHWLLPSTVLALVLAATLQAGVEISPIAGESQASVGLSSMGALTPALGLTTLVAGVIFVVARLQRSPKGV